LAVLAVLAVSLTVFTAPVDICRPLVLAVLAVLAVSLAVLAAPVDFCRPRPLVLAVLAVFLAVKTVFNAPVGIHKPLPRVFNVYNLVYSSIFSVSLCAGRCAKSIFIFETFGLISA
jgi:hypothetical protein